MHSFSCGLFCLYSLNGVGVFYLFYVIFVRNPNKQYFVIFNEALLYRAKCCKFVVLISRVKFAPKIKNNMEIINTENGLVRYSPIDQSVWEKQEPRLISFIRENHNMILEGLGVQPQTIATYKYNIGDFVKFISNNGLNIQTPIKYWQHINDRVDIGAQAKQMRIVAARHLLKELFFTYQFLPLDLSVRFKSFRVSKEHKKTGFTPEEVGKILTYLNELKQSPGTRNKGKRLTAMVSLLCFQGLRVSEVCDLKLEDIDFATGSFWVTGKARHDRTSCAFLGDTLEALKDYIKAFQIKSGFLFFSVDTINKNKRKKLTTNGARAIFYRIKHYNGKKGKTMREYGLLVKLGIKNRSPHAGRHYFITSLLIESNGNVVHVQKLARIKSLEVVKAYNDEINARKIAEQYKRVESFNIKSLIKQST